MVQFIQRVDLEWVEKRLSGDSSTTSDDQLRHTHDYAIFLNFVDFCKRLLKHTRPEFLSECDWVYILGREIITKCQTCQHVSGLYKIFTAILEVAREQKYFDKKGGKGGEMDTVTSP